MRRFFPTGVARLVCVVVCCSACVAADQNSVIQSFLARYCIDCHGADTQQAALDLHALPTDFNNPEHFRRWRRVHDRIVSGEMPPKDAEQPSADERSTIAGALSALLMAAERETSADLPRLRRMTRAEYENTIRDLFDMPGIALAGSLPADGTAHGFDKHPDALDISHVNLAKYLDAADHILDYAIAARPEPPTIRQRRISLVNRGGFVAHVVMNGDGVLLQDKRPDPEFPPAADQNHLDQGAHERWGSFRNGATVGLFRHEDESFNPYFIEHVTIYPGRYRVRTSLWSFQWDKGTVLPGRGTEAGRLSVVQLTGDGRGGQHPSYVLGYFDAPDKVAREHELVVWLNHNELIGFNTASLAPVANYSRKGRALAFTGPGIAVDWLQIEGPLFETWPPQSHRVLFADLPLAEFRAEEHPDVRPPQRTKVRQLGAGQNRPDPDVGLWTVISDAPLQDAERLLSAFLPRLFRRPVSAEVRQDYLEIVQERIAAGDCFEMAMRAAYRRALISPDFLYHIESTDPAISLARRSAHESPSRSGDRSEPSGQERRQSTDGGTLRRPDDFGLACRLAYFLWNSLPDEQLRRHAAAGILRQPDILHAEIERLLHDPRSDRFVRDFPDQWLKLRQIAANDPDKKLYPEFSPYLQDAMIAETRAYFRHLLENDLDVTHVVKSDFVMVNQKLAAHYGIANVEGTQFRPVALDEDCPRGGFLTQASILKLTANGTTTSPVPRGAFVIDRILGEPPEPPPPSVAAIEPDVRGTTTIRDQLAKHREHPVCASCHQRIDPPGFALESFDVIGGYRSRYRSIGEGDAAERGAIDPFIGISFRLGPAVDSSGILPDGRAFEDIRQYQMLLAADSDRLLNNLTRQFLVYATGRAVRFSDRPAVEAIVRRTQAQNGGIRTLLHEVIGSPLFTGGPATVEQPAGIRAQRRAEFSDHSHRTLMATTLPDVPAPVLRSAPENAESRTVPEFEFSDRHSTTLRVRGLFLADRVADFRRLMTQIPEVSLQHIEFDTARATFHYAADSDLFRNANPMQIAERLDARVRQMSTGLFSVKPIGPVPQEELQRIEIRITGLDCKACSLAVHDILARVEGVEYATASFRDGLAVAWVDSASTSCMALEAALTQRGVTLTSE